MQADEQELIARSLRSDTAAYGMLVERYKNAVYHHCFAIVHDEAIAEDITQETFIASYYKLGHYDTSRRFSTWLFKVATNKALTELRKHKHSVTTDDAFFDRLKSSLPDPNTVAECREIHQAVTALPPKYRLVISLYYWHGESYQEIAEVLGVPQGTIKGWMNRAKKQLRKELV